MGMSRVMLMVSAQGAARAGDGAEVQPHEEARVLGLGDENVPFARIAKAGDPSDGLEARMADDRSLNRAEVDDGIRRISRQLDLLRAGPTLGEPSDDAHVIAELEAELAALRQCAQAPS